MGRALPFSKLQNGLSIFNCVADLVIGFKHANLIVFTAASY